MQVVDIVGEAGRDVQGQYGKYIKLSKFTKLVQVCCQVILSKIL